MDKESFLVIKTAKNYEPPLKVTHCGEDKLIHLSADLMIPVQQIEAEFNGKTYYGEVSYILIEKKLTGNYDVFQGKIL